MPAKTLPLTAGLILASGPALAGGLSFAVTLPEIEAAPYYRPYLAAWVEDEAKAVQGTAAVWYDTRLKNNIGTTFLRELRSWWRATGKTLEMPADGITGPTRPPGRHEVVLEASHPALAGLEPGNYVLAVEVTREDGGRDLLRAPFTWGGAGTAEAVGEGEITALSVTTTP